MLRNAIKNKENGNKEIANDVLLKTIQKLQAEIKLLEAKNLKIVYSNIEGIALGKNVSISEGCSIEKNVRIGDYTYIRPGTYIRANSTIGKYCSIASSVQLGPIPHPTTWMSTHPFQYTIDEIEPNVSARKKIYKYKTRLSCTIGNDVWIGARAMIKPGVSIGDGAIIGAHAIVTKNVPAYAIVGGVPAKVIKRRFSDDTIKELLSLKWWDLPFEVLSSGEIDFDDIHKAITKIKELKSSRQPL